MRIHSRRRLSYGTFRRTDKQRLVLFLALCFATDSYAGTIT